MEGLEAVAEHGPIWLIENGGRHVNHEVRVDAEEMSVERGVVEFAD